MSIASAKAFIEQMKTDAAVASRVKEIGYEHTRLMLAYAEELGLAFDEQDMQRMKSQALQRCDELSDQELAPVVGGWERVGGLGLAFEDQRISQKGVGLLWAKCHKEQT